MTKIVEIPTVGVAISQDLHELATEQEPREIMNDHSDRAELFDSWTRPPRKAMNERSDRAELSDS